MTATESKLDYDAISHLFYRLDLLRDNLRSVIRGKAETIDQVVVALLSGGSILIEDVPGVGKTTLAKAIAASIELDFCRIQCTPDLLPADVLGFSVFDPQAAEFRFRKGPVFTNILLVDEINRASPRTQSALLEAMEEKQVSVEGKRHELPNPFNVLATQNPLGFQGTFPLPEAQLDRFLIRIKMDYPEADQEVEILFDHMASAPVSSIKPVLTQQDLLACQAAVRQVMVQPVVAEYMVQIVHQTRLDSRIRVGCSPRGSLMLCRVAQALALTEQRNFVLPDDVQKVAPIVLAHRIGLTSGNNATSEMQVELINELVARAKVPV